ncbi:AraC-like DNA-binding protein [Chitinophaga skermanii]|uniref:AraC-like DNA-binding protein n=1 Tax=Chitinophaga skermanii TaxID=331697 RepID=A0A327Q3Y8_9BACT|nr:AraC family transcriptional regulator [Chitinophaga skermanii]RAI97892.1 AraC-like DNA-binding protein [Chitinophaga skermanii]
MKFTDIKSCYIGPTISPEQFVQEHMFLFLAKGSIDGYDGNKHYVLHPGEACVVRKNHLARYHKNKENNAFEKVVIIFDEVFLKAFQARHAFSLQTYFGKEAFIKFPPAELIHNFIHSLTPYFTEEGKLHQSFADIKREELLLILLQLNPALAGVFFDFGVPGKIDLEAFMQKNYKFNVSIERFAYLSGRSLSAFKRDFKEIFQQTPSRWLTGRRLDEAKFLIEKDLKRPSDIYVELGFEDLSHFSFAFKKQFGYAPTALLLKSK